MTTPSKQDFILAAQIEAWLTAQGCTTSLSLCGDRLEVYYTLAEDFKPQPPILIKDEGISIPAGSQQAMLDAILTWLMGG